MYPYETPFGIIMKINRNPIVALPDDVFKRDHAFWSKYSERMIGNWITYDTSVQQIADWVEKVYLRGDYTGFTGDRKFIRVCLAAPSAVPKSAARPGIHVLPSEKRRGGPAIV